MRAAFSTIAKIWKQLKWCLSVYEWIKKIWGYTCVYIIHVRTYACMLLSHFSRVRLCDPIDGSPLGSSVPGILQARILEWVAISFSNA